MQNLQAKNIKKGHFFADKSPIFIEKRSIKVYNKDITERLGKES